MTFTVMYRGLDTFLFDEYKDHTFTIEHGVLRVRKNTGRGGYHETKIYKDWVHIQYADKAASQS